jgi:hypothetical protein
MPTENNAILELLDKQACIETLTRYCRALDWLDGEELNRVFAADADIDYGFYRGQREGFIKAVMEIEHSFTRRWHFVANAIVQVTGDTAESECYGLAAAASVKDGRTTTNVFGGRYLDRLARRNGQWLITWRQYVLDWQQTFEADAASEALPGLLWSNGFNPQHALYRKL